MARAFRDLWSLVMFFKFSNCTRLWLVQFWELEKHYLSYTNAFLHTPLFAQQFRLVLVGSDTNCLLASSEKLDH